MDNDMEWLKTTKAACTIQLFTLLFTKETHLALNRSHTAVCLNNYNHCLDRHHQTDRLSKLSGKLSRQTRDPGAIKVQLHRRRPVRVKAQIPCYVATPSPDRKKLAMHVLTKQQVLENHQAPWYDTEYIHDDWLETAGRQKPYRVMVDSDGTDDGSTNSGDSHKAMLPFTNVDNTLIEAHQARNVFSKVWTHT